MKKSNVFLAVVVLATFNFVLCTLNSLAQYTKLLDFNGVANGDFPVGSFISDGTYLYGMTKQGGTGNPNGPCGYAGCGVVYKIMPDGTGYAKLLDFDYFNGGRPYGSLYFDGTFLYGTTTSGGSLSATETGSGEIFKIKTDGTGFDTLHVFSLITDGIDSRCTLVSDGTYLYGTTRTGGTGSCIGGGCGVIYKIKKDGTEYTKLLDFAGISNGSHPCGSLYYDGTFLYGMTYDGGTNGDGTIFKIKTDGSNYVKLLDFSLNVTGRFPYASLISDGTYLYGTVCGSEYGSGIIFKIKPDGTGYSKLFESTPIAPYGTLITDGTYLYGTGSVIFKIKPDGTAYRKMFEYEPYSYEMSNDLFTDGTYIYGTTSGSYSMGTIFKLGFTAGDAQYTTTYDTLQNTFYLTIDSTTSALAVSYLWDFGDGTTSTLATPSHVYTVDSVFNVCLKIYLADGDSSSYCHLLGKDMYGNITRDAGFTINVHASGISSNLSDETNITVYPNPTNGVFHIAGDRNQLTGIEVYNMLGEKIYSRNDNLQKVTSDIDISYSPKGIYFIKINEGKVFHTKKILVN